MGVSKCVIALEENGSEKLGAEGTGGYIRPVFKAGEKLDPESSCETKGVRHFLISTVGGLKVGHKPDTWELVDPSPRCQRSRKKEDRPC